jgi:hypothetical protein
VLSGWKFVQVPLQHCALPVQFSMPSIMQVPPSTASRQCPLASHAPLQHWAFCWHGTPGLPHAAPSASSPASPPSPAEPEDEPDDEPLLDPDEEPEDELPDDDPDEEPDDEPEDEPELLPLVASPPLAASVPPPPCPPPLLPPLQAGAATAARESIDAHIARRQKEGFIWGVTQKHAPTGHTKIAMFPHRRCHEQVRS